MYHKKQSGFSFLYLLVALLVVILICFATYLVFNRKTQTSDSGKKQSDVSLEQKTLTYEQGIRLQPSDFGVAAGLPVADVSAVKLPDGRWRIYAFAQNQGIVSAISNDGLIFKAENGVRQGGGAGMPRTIKLNDGRYRMYFIEKGGVGSSVSGNGLDFTTEPGLRITQPKGVKEISGISTPIKLSDDKWHVYFSDLPRPGDGLKPHVIYSATSLDLYTWELDDGFRIGGDKVAKTAEHPDAVLRPDGKLLLYYFINDSQKLVTSLTSDGLVFSDYHETGLDCNDPNIVTIGDGNYRIYCGKFDKSIGGFVKSSLVKSLP